MKNIIKQLFIVCLLFITNISVAQLKPDPKKVKAMILTEINKLDNSIFVDLSKKFAACAKNDLTSTTELYNFIHVKTSGLEPIDKTIGVFKDHLLPDRDLYLPEIQQELDDYMQSLLLTKIEALSLNKSTDFKLNAFNNQRFISAYNNMKMARSMLKMTIDNLLENLALDAKVSKISDAAIKIDSTVKLSFDKVNIIDSNTSNLQVRLDSTILRINKNTNKKTMTWGLIGGVLGGLLGGFIAGSIIK